MAKMLSHQASLPLYAPSMALSFVALFGAELVVHADESFWLPLVYSVGGFAVALVGSVFIWRRWHQLSQPPNVVLMSFVLLALGPIAASYLAPYLSLEPQPVEIQLLQCLEIIMLGLVASGRWRRACYLLGVVSLFLMVASLALAFDARIMYVLIAYAVVGLAWLVVYQGFQLREQTQGLAQLVRSERIQARRLPVLAISLTLLAVLAIFVGAALLSSNRWSGSWLELLGSSGGTSLLRWEARGGLGDGPDEVAGQNARSAGMVESDWMIEDYRDSLIDVITETYGEPLRIRQPHEKMLPGQYARIIQHHGHLPENLSPNREFALHRKRPKNPPQPFTGRAARALLEIQGRTPLHLRRVVYDEYDEQAHSWQPAHYVAPRVIEPVGGSWLEVRSAMEAGSWYWADDYHTIKIARLEENFVPAPPLLKGLQLRHALLAEHHFQWNYDDVLALRDRKRWPSGVVLTTWCRTVSYEAIPAAAWLPIEQSLPPTVSKRRYTGVPQSLEPRLKQLAQKWAGAAEPGWPQISAILTHLREHYTLDRTLTAPAEHPQPILWFLEESHCGPDYFFASSAVLLLRALGYPARLCLGYYAAPEAYDPITRYTPVTTHDIHFWAEVRLRDGNWVVLEATPGYSTLPPKIPWRQLLLDTVRGVAAWVQKHAVALALSAGLILFLWWQRRRWLEWLWRCRWAWARRFAPLDLLVRLTWQIVEWRARAAGLIRPPWQTPSAWLKEMELPLGLPAEFVHHFGSCLNHAYYAPHLSAQQDRGDGLDLCHRALGLLTYERWRRANHSRSILHGAPTTRTTRRGSRSRPRVRALAH
ncbi:MAG: hypothetical protein NZ914_13000 [Gemmatales bacterium]|nr:hypothetical protein [Gemmatales bacterium]